MTIIEDYTFADEMKELKDHTVHTDPVAKIKEEARRIGFSAVGIAAAAPVPEEIRRDYLDAMDTGRYDGLTYLQRHEDLRFDPRILLPGCKSVLVVALNYYPRRRQEVGVPRISIYAYGKDYHRVLKRRLDVLLAFIRQEIDPTVCGRSFTDSAPILERYWAVQAGIGWQGKNGLIVLPGQGSYFFLGVLLLSTELKPDTPIASHCGQCTRCVDACPTSALATDGFAADRCLSYLTIEQSDELTAEQVEALGDRLYGCDTCQDVCPHNRFARPTTVNEFAPHSTLFDLTYDRLKVFTETDYLHFFGGTAVKRAGYKGMLRNIRALERATQGANIQSEGCFIRGHYVGRAEIKAFRTEAESSGDAYLISLSAFIDRWFESENTMPVYTSGSTGQPRLIEKTKAAMRLSAIRTCRYFGLQRTDKVLLSLPLRYVAAQMMVVRAIVAGLDLYPAAPSSCPVSLFGTGESFAFAPFVPLQAYTMLSNPETRAKMRCIDKVLLGGAALDADLESKLRLEPNAYYMGYGMTETLTHIALRRINGSEMSDYYRPLSGVSIAQDHEGCAVIGQEGEAALTTNDIIKLREDGAFKILGRRDHVVNSGGIKVHPEEIEHILGSYLSDPFCVVGLPDKRLGQRLVLVVEENAELPPLPLDCLESVGLPAVPKEVYRRMLPRTETGKIDRLSLVRDLLKA